MPVNRNPTVRQRRLARTLRELRVGAGLTLLQVAQRLECAESKISRIETALSGVRPIDLRMMLDFYGVTNVELRRELEELSRNARLRGWWDRYSDVLSPRYAQFISLEADASKVRSMQTLLIPGLLQTEEYTRAVLRIQVEGATPAQIETHTQVRQERRSVLTRKPPLEMCVVLSERVLRHGVGGPDVMLQQLEYLAAAAESPNIEIRILPDESTIHAALLNPVTILSFPESSETDVVYADHLLGTIYFEDPAEIDMYASLFRRASEEALSPEKSIALIERVSKEMG